MTNPEQQQITPPPELVRKWYGQIPSYGVPIDYIATQAARWGADQELEACCEWFQEFYKTESWSKRDLEHFRAVRRPKPPSLKERALSALWGPREGPRPPCSALKNKMAVLDAPAVIRALVEQAGSTKHWHIDQLNAIAAELETLPNG